MSRTAKTMIAYIPDLPGVSVTLKTAGDYTHIGLVHNWQTSEWETVAKGWSPKSVAKATRTAGRKMYAHALQFVNAATAVAELHEVTAPLIADYFDGDHRVAVVSYFKPGSGWTSVRWKAGRSNLRWMASQGIAAVAVRQDHGAREADFQMTEILRSLNSRRASV